MIAKLSNHIAVNMRGRLEERLDQKAAGKALDAQRASDDDHTGQKRRPHWAQASLLDGAFDFYGVKVRLQEEEKERLVGSLLV